jgi:rod shape-determining protein MreC
MRTLLRFIQKYSNLLLFLLLEAVAIILLARDPGYHKSKIVGLNRQVSGYIFSRVDGAREYLSLREMNQVLVEENSTLRNAVDSLLTLTDSSVVRTEYKDPYRYSYVPARVIRNNVFRQYNYLTLDRGRKDGVYRDMGVVSEKGLVGIVLDVSGNFSTVIPVINRDFRLSVKLTSNNYAGILQWDGSSPGIAQLGEIPFHVELQRGDTVSTSGFSSIFPEGIIVGTVEDFTLEKGNFYEIQVKLSTDFQGLFHVNVIRNFRQEEQRNLEEQSG